MSLARRAECRDQYAAFSTGDGSVIAERNRHLDVGLIVTIVRVEFGTGVVFHEAHLVTVVDHLARRMHIAQATPIGT